VYFLRRLRRGHFAQHLPQLRRRPRPTAHQTRQHAGPPSSIDQTRIEGGWVPAGGVTGSTNPVITRLNRVINSLLGVAQRMGWKNVAHSAAFGEIALAADCDFKVAGWRFAYLTYSLLRHGRKPAFSFQNRKVFDFAGKLATLKTLTYCFGTSPGGEGSGSGQGCRGPMAGAKGGFSGFGIHTTSPSGTGVMGM